ncbi:MAG: CDGSH iron-sulfur domain-containing protein [Pseudomonadota bacterium]
MEVCGSEARKTAPKAPYPVEVEEGKTCFWCSCGPSAHKPFCDESQKDTEFTPLKYVAEQAGKVFLCGCKATAKTTLCDGWRSKL